MDCISQSCFDTPLSPPSHENPLAKDWNRLNPSADGQQLPPPELSSQYPSHLAQPGGLSSQNEEPPI